MPWNSTAFEEDRIFSVSIVIPARNRSEDLADLLFSIPKQRILCLIQSYVWTFRHIDRVKSGGFSSLMHFVNSIGT